MADEPSAKRARIEPASMPHIPMELIVGPVACILLRARDKTLTELLQTCWHCVHAIPGQIVSTVLTMRAHCWSPWLGDRVFRAALRAGRSADEMDHILVVFGCERLTIVDWLVREPDAETLLRRVAPLCLTRPGLLHRAAFVFAVRPTLLNALCEIALNASHVAGLVRELVVHCGLSAPIRSMIMRLHQGRRCVGIHLSLSDFLRFINTASDDDFDWMIHNCPLRAHISHDTASQTPPPRIAKILESYPYSVLSAFHPEPYQIAEFRPFENIDILWLRLLFHDCPHMGTYFANHALTQAAARALLSVGVVISVSTLMKNALFVDELLGNDVVTADQRLVCDYLRMRRESATHVPTADELRAFCMRAKTYLT